MGLALALTIPVWGAEVGNLYQVKEGRFKLELKAEHQIRDITLKEPFTIILEPEYPPYPPEPGQYWDRYYLTFKSFDGEEIIHRYYLKASLAIFDRLELYAKGGVSRLKFKFFDPKQIWRGEEWRFDGKEWYPTEYWWEEDWLSWPLMGKGKWGTFYGGGVKLILLRWDTFQAGFDLQYLLEEADSDVVIYEYSEEYHAPDYWYYYLEEMKLIHTKTTEIHIAILASRKMDNFFPYGGVKYSLYKTEYQGKWRYIEEEYQEVVEKFESEFEFETEPQDFIGLFIGADYNLTDGLGVNGEIRLGDEFAASVGLFCKF
jgi:hypothetical protein